MGDLTCHKLEHVNRIAALPMFKVFRPSPVLAHAVDSILDLDFPDAGAARALTIKALPSTTPALAVIYRRGTQADVHWTNNSISFGHNGDKHTASKLETGIVTTRPKGPIGSFIIRLKPEAGTRVLGACMQEFADRRVELGDIFSVGEVSLLEEMLAEAKDSAERVACVESFLLRQVREAQPDPVVSRAVSLLRKVPSLTVRQLALKLEISEVHLRRRFKATAGSTPKQFARIARIEKLLVARRTGLAWAEAACACGFQDQAHMIHDFNLIAGQSPDHFLRTAWLVPGVETLSVYQSRQDAVT
jgi:AraC-like DNA-binding protein